MASDTGMRLNEYPADHGGGSGGGQQDLVSTPAEKKAAAKAIEDHIEPETKKAGDYADEATSGVVKAFDAKDGHGWLMSSSLKKAHKTWGEQVRTLMNRLGSEKVALRSSNTILANTDFRVSAGARAVRTPSALDQY
ncbi:hypothetical protein [Streptomyces xinghaiensis]|uniref:hypothetical protein n=1 Tax=Streptomyces xinghaiensis TaxID=1038928 RepID=UPI00068228D3|nr:hypothetical protein [Streptomyces xinghaiensis]MZE76941.1 hypothetical protein [Streptomyces sp. SID5475]